MKNQYKIQAFNCAYLNLEKYGLKKTELHSHGKKGKTF